MAGLNGLGINLVKMSKLYDEQFVLIMKGVDSEVNTKVRLPSSCVSQHVAQLLKEFEDVLTNEIPNDFHPKRMSITKFDLTPRAEPPNKAPYRLNQSELEELKSQFTEFLKRGYIRPSKSPFGTPILLL